MIRIGNYITLLHYEQIQCHLGQGKSGVVKEGREKERQRESETERERER